MFAAKKPLPVISIVLILGLLLLWSGCGEEEAKTLDPTTIGEYNKPGVVLVETTWTADVTVPEIDLNTDALINYIVSLVQNGTLPVDMTDDELLDVLIAELATNPQLYVYALPTDRETSMESSVYGSGFIVTEDGYLLTNAHVVKKSDDELRTQMAVEAASDFLTEDLYAFEEYLGVDLPPEYEDYFLEATANVYDQYMTVSSPDSDTRMYMVNVEGELGDPLTAEIVEVGDPIDMMEETGKDVAVLKVNDNNLPTVAVGDDSDLQDGEQVIALGYPAISTFDPGFDLTNITPTLTQGTISAQKTMEGGWKVIQTDADISSGSSGSPLLDNKGEAIGINTFGASQLNEQTGEVETQPGYNYAIPASVAQEFLDEANVEAQLGPLTVKYREAVDYYEDEHYKDAKELFQEVDEANSDFPYVDEYIENSTAKINEGLDKSGFAIPVWLLIVLIAAGAMIIAGLLVLFIVIIPKNKQKKEAGTEATAISTAAVAEPAPAADATVETVTAEIPAGGAAPTEPGTEKAPSEAPPPETPAEEAASKEEGETEEQHFCSQCGHKLDPVDEFCSKCGAHKK